ncbi:MAG TPA: FtsX-like permease family protein, partial [Pseudidiomarina sp.]|nr:FtsX-like permease family protein [Pseudidiomarina sp.]
AAGGGVFTPLGLVPAQRQFTVIGIVAMQSEADSQLLLLHGADVARLLRMAPNSITELRYYFNDPFLALPAQQALNTWFVETERNLETVSWREAYGELFDAVALEKRMVSLMLGLIIAVAAFNIVSALMMMIQDKRADIAILQTMGMRRRGIQLMFLLQGMHNGVIGSLIGLLIGLAGSWWINDLIAVLGVDMSLVGGSGLPVVIDTRQIAWILVAACALSIVATVYPAWRASRILPAQALRYE